MRPRSLRASALGKKTDHPDRGAHTVHKEIRERRLPTDNPTYPASETLWDDADRRNAGWGAGCEEKNGSKCQQWDILKTACHKRSPQDKHTSHATETVPVKSITSVGGEQHCLCSWRRAHTWFPLGRRQPARRLSGLPGGVSPEGSKGTSAPRTPSSWKRAAAAKVRCPRDFTPHSLSLRCKCSAPSHTQTPGPLGTGSLALRSGCNECLWTPRSSVQHRDGRSPEAPRYTPSSLLAERHTDILIKTGFSAASFIQRTSGEISECIFEVGGGERNRCFWKSEGNR